VFLLAQRRQQLSFQRNAFGQRRRRAAALQAVGQRMAAARFGVALHQRGRVGIQEDDPQTRAHGAQRGDHVGQFGEFPRRAHVDGDGDAFHAVIARLRNELGQETDGKIVDTGVARVLEHAQRDGFAGTGNAGDEDDFQHGHDCGTLFQDDAGGIASDMAINSGSAPVPCCMP